MRFFWQISGEITTWTIRKMIAARTRIWPAKGHYMGPDLGVFWRKTVFNGLDFQD
jgi:hypothetical protein